MESLDLLAREDEFKKLNYQLEKKSETLRKQIEHAMQKQDIFSDFSHSTIFNTQKIKKKHFCSSDNSTPEQNTPVKIKNKLKTKERTKCIKKESLKINSSQSESSELDIDSNSSEKVLCTCCSNSITEELEFLYAFVSISVQEKILPQSFLKDKVTIENVCKFLSSKVKLMQEQIDQLQATVDKKAAQCEKHLTLTAELESERMVLLNKNNNMRAETVDARTKYAAVQKRLEEKERLYKEQRSQNDKLSSEIKKLASKNNTLEARLAAQEEQIESLKGQLDHAKRNEKEFRDSTRNLSASHQNAILRLEARIKHLTDSIDKQASLIDNLRKQNTLLSMDGALKTLEKDYNEFLSQDL